MKATRRSIFGMIAAAMVVRKAEPLEAVAPEVRAAPPLVYTGTFYTASTSSAFGTVPVASPTAATDVFWNGQRWVPWLPGAEFLTNVRRQR